VAHLEDNVRAAEAVPTTGLSLTGWSVCWQRGSLVLTNNEKPFGIGLLVRKPLENVAHAKDD
jgi:hypothetical protein